MKSLLAVIFTVFFSAIILVPSSGPNGGNEGNNFKCHPGEKCLVRMGGAETN